MLFSVVRMASRLTEFLYKEKGRDREPLVLFDVGCSGGIGEQWDVFGALLHATGFDPLEPEIERLRGLEQRATVSYEAAFVGLNPDQQKDCEEHGKSLPARAALGHYWFARSSAFEGARILSYNYEKEIHNAGKNVTHSPRRFSLDEYCEQTATQRVDFLKTDTDGHDVKILMGGSRILEESLGAYVECSSFGSSLNKYANTFCNVDTLMNDKGFTLFDLRLRKYTRAALPGPFKYDIFASTVNGSLNWADALYLRDLADLEYEQMFGFCITPEVIIKTACLLEVFGLEDCAAELLIRRGDLLPYAADQLLDLLVPDFLGPGLSYREYIKTFESDPRALFPSHAADRHRVAPEPVLESGHQGLFPSRGKAIMKRDLHKMVHRGLAYGRRRLLSAFRGTR
jgi:Methyltransferase FkbM domain